MDALFGIPTARLTVALSLVTLLTLAGTAALAVRRRILLRLGARNLLRRPLRSVIIVVGLALSTVVIATAFSIGDAMTLTLRSLISGSLGQVDEVVTANQFNTNQLTRQRLDDLTSGSVPSGAAGYFPAAQYQRLHDALRGSHVIVGLTPAILEQATAADGEAQQARSDVGILAIPPDNATGFAPMKDGDGRIRGLAELGPSEVYVNAAAAKLLSTDASRLLRVYLAPSDEAVASTPSTAAEHDFTVRAVLTNGALGGAQPTVFLPLAALQQRLAKPAQLNEILVVNHGGTDSVTHSREAALELPTVESTIGWLTGWTERERVQWPDAVGTPIEESWAAMARLVDEGKLDWDKPIRQYVPSIKFYNDDLDRTITVRDMLSHRTGITRHDLIWYKSDFTQKELFDRLRYLEPTEPPRTTFLYNNMMYSGTGYAIELLSGKPWQTFVTERVLQPLGMTSTTFTIEDMLKLPEPGVPYTERRDNTELYRIPYYSDAIGVAPAGAINSNIVDISHWLIALMNAGVYNGRQVLPKSVIRQTLAPSIALPNTALEVRGWGELLNSYYGMGRWVASYRGHVLAFHGGDLPGFHSQISAMPYDSIGVIVLVIGNHAAPLYNIVSWNVYERLLGMSLTPWSERQNTIRLKNKEADKTARTKAGAGRVANTRPSHRIADYVGE